LPALKACGENVLVQYLVEQVMHGHLVLFAALFVESQPTAGTIVIVIVDPEFQYCADPGEAVRACLERSYFACEPPDHQLDHGDSDPRFGRFGQGVEVLTQSARAVEPAEGAFDDPAPLQDPKFLALRRPFHDRKGALQNSGYPINQLAGVTPDWPNKLQPRKAGDQPGEYLFGSITILDPGRMDHHDQKQTKDVDDYMTLTTQDALARVIAADPPFSVVFTV
jgi:hypothetical protein